jgi:hypothetical protein
MKRIDVLNVVRPELVGAAWNLAPCYAHRFGRCLVRAGRVRNQHRVRLQQGFQRGPNLRRALGTDGSTEIKQSFVPRAIAVRTGTSSFEMPRLLARSPRLCAGRGMPFSGLYTSDVIGLGNAWKLGGLVLLQQRHHQVTVTKRGIAVNAEFVCDVPNRHERLHARGVLQQDCLAMDVTERGSGEPGEGLPAAVATAPIALLPGVRMAPPAEVGSAAVWACALALEARFRHVLNLSAAVQLTNRLRQPHQLLAC